jgi:hypothetical protein
MDLRRCSTHLVGALLALTTTLTAGCFTDSALTSSGAATADVTSATSDTQSASDSASGTSSAGSVSSGESEGTSTSASTSDATTTASTSTTDTTGTTLPQPTTTSGTTDAPTTSGTTDAPTTFGTTGGQDLLVEACVASCEVYVQCTGANKEACLASCTSEPPTGPCLDARIETLKCIGDLSCMQLQQPVICPHQQSLEVVQCDDCDVVLKNEGTSCAAHYLCDKHDYSIACEGNSCTCTTDEQIAGGCALEVDLCALDEDALLLEAAGCCTWYQGD